MKKLILSIFAIASVTLQAQSPYTQILQQIEQNSTTLRAHRANQAAEALGNKTGLLPDDPDIEFANKWQHPSAPTTVKEVGVSQSFDFPTVYTQRKHLSKIQTENSELLYNSHRMQLLLEAKNICIRLTYCNAMHRLFSIRADYARRMAEAHERMYQNGELNQMERNKATLNYSHVQNELTRIDIEREQLLADLKRMNGGTDIACDTEQFVVEAVPADFNAWFATTESCHPHLRLLRSQENIAARRVRLTRAETLPKWSVGYMGEFVGSERTQGFRVGLSIPLWQNKNRVKHAKAQTAAALQTTTDARTQLEHRLKSLHTEVVRLQKNVATYRQALQANDNEKLLQKAYKQGEISLLDYLQELEYIYSCHTQLIEAERDLALAMAELMAHEL